MTDHTLEKAGGVKLRNARILARIKSVHTLKIGMTNGEATGHVSRSTFGTLVHPADQHYLKALDANAVDNARVW